MPHTSPISFSGLITCKIFCTYTLKCSSLRSLLFSLVSSSVSHPNIFLSSKTPSYKHSIIRRKLLCLLVRNCKLRTHNELITFVDPSVSFILNHVHVYSNTYALTSLTDINKLEWNLTLCIWDHIVGNYVITTGWRIVSFGMICLSDLQINTSVWKAVWFFETYVTIYETTSRSI
jgi:hypothetical protein